MIKITVKKIRPSAEIPFYAIAPEKLAGYINHFEATGKSSYRLVSMTSDFLEKVEEFIWAEDALAEWDSQWAPEFNAARDAYEAANGITRQVISVENI